MVNVAFHLRVLTFFKVAIIHLKGRLCFEG